MAVTPPQNDADPDVIEFGIAALAPRLDDADLRYPATAADVLDAVGDPSVPCDASGNEVQLSEALAQLPRSEFDSQRDLLDALHPVFEEYRATRSSGVLGQLRAMLPF